MIEIILDAKTGEITEKDYTAEQIEETVKAQQDAELKRTIVLERQKTKNALLERLGITEDEAKLLLS